MCVYLYVCEHLCVKERHRNMQICDTEKLFRLMLMHFLLTIMSNKKLTYYHIGNVGRLWTCPKDVIKNCLKLIFSSLFPFSLFTEL